MVGLGLEPLQLLLQQGNLFVLLDYNLFEDLGLIPGAHTLLLADLRQLVLLN